MTTSPQLAIGLPAVARPRRRRFFLAIALFAIVILILAFTPEYIEYVHGTFPIAWILHIHGAIMAAWVTLFLVQAYLGATGRIAQHRSLGSFAMAVGWLAWISMIFVEWRALVVYPPPVDVTLYDRLLPGPYVYLTFPIFLGWAYRTRRQPDWHKRLMTFALFLPLQAAIQRFAWIPRGFGYWPFAVLLDISLLLPLLMYDATTLKKRVHSATLRGALVLFFAQGILFLLWGTELWRNFASTVAHTVAHR
jgi:hypothetical protein